MKREYLPTEALVAWARLNGVKFRDVAIQQLRDETGVDKGAAVVATAKKAAKEPSDVEGQTVRPDILMTVPPELVLSLDQVGACAKADRQLTEVLDAMGDFAKTARGAILIFLLVHITYSDPDLHGDASSEHLRVCNPWTEYIKFLPKSFLLPTFYTIEERELLHGTSLEVALDAKLNSLEKEFEWLREATTSIPWCVREWWNEETGRLSVEDWKLVDAMYRSRVLELPGTGHAMVPCVDMANHASGNDTGALYETGETGNAALQLRWGQSLNPGDEVTITYGDEKGAAEMIFSYGFLEGGLTNARQLFLSLDIPDDDPLRLAKKAFCNDAPGFRLFTPSESPPSSSSAESIQTDWESAFVWWACVNEEDGLEFRILQSTDGNSELKVSFKSQDLDSSDQLERLLKDDPMWHVFQLRAVVTVQDRVANQIAQLRGSDEYVEQWRELVDETAIRRVVWDMATRLRKLEEDLLEQGARDLEEKKLQLLDSKVVQAYLGTQNPGAEIEEDFS
ncbi:hypothetical protein AJ80_06108 [Polytolypa hystricis UAMH7299]|uniref:SET domain-containing protein n=1 Tax=Polytolypa hystricis (strain UAMH7299) TaxID=1447883 RepID=A0A2B7XZH4_POLH7|nr:hypothetical protein AJ80_06108 [Polytolypa hystricis UAMH7299]